MKDKKQKWEVLFEDYSSGNLDKKIKELEDNHSIEIKNKKDTKDKGESTKNYMKQKKQLENIKENLPKIQNLIEFKDKVSTTKNEIDSELKNRKNLSNLTEEQEMLDKEIELIMSITEQLNQKLKSKDISDEDRKKIQEQLDKADKKRAENSDRYAKNSQELLNPKGKLGKFEKISNEDLEMMSSKLSIQLSKVNFYGNRLIKGYNIESIKASEKTSDWKMKALGKDAEKMSELRATAKNEKEIEKTTGKLITKDVEKDEEKSMIEVSEFEQKHPRLAKIKKFFTNLRDKIHKTSDKDDKGDEEEIKEGKEESKEGKEESKEGKEESKEEGISGNKHKEFVKILQNMDEYEIYDVAEKGLDGIKEERMAAARQKLQENKEKHANGLTPEEKGQKDNSEELEK